MSATAVDRHPSAGPRLLGAAALGAARPYDDVARFQAAATRLLTGLANSVPPKPGSAGRV